jgi:polyvinyl alcohol dehydrogenase (cytochrome)
MGRAKGEDGDKYARRTRRRHIVALAGLALSLALLAVELAVWVWPASMRQVEQVDVGTSAAFDGNGHADLPVSPIPTSTAISQRLARMEAATGGPPVPGDIGLGDWPSYLNVEGTGYNPDETTITASTATTLKVLWKQQGILPISAQPTVADGLVFWGDWGGNEHATLVNGTAVWSTYLGRTWPGSLDPCGFSYSPNPGIASTAALANVNGQFTLFVGGGDGQLYALNAFTGAILWHTRLGAYEQGFVWSSPAVYNGSVYSSLASFSDCPLVRGEVVRLNAATGAIQNIFYVVPEGCVGGTVWGSPIVDPSEGAVFIATGGPNVYGGPCDPDGPYTSSVLKFSTSTFTLLDQWQVPASQQIEDGDFGNTPTLFTATIGGVTHALIGITHKNGYYYALDRDHLSAGPVWEQQLNFPDGLGIYAPSAFDGQHLYLTASGTTAGGQYCGAGAIRALNPASGATIWGRCLSEGLTYGAVSVVPGVVIVGAGSWTVVLSAQTGATLYEYHHPGGDQLYGAAAVAHGVIYQGDRDGVLTAFSL